MKAILSQKPGSEPDFRDYNELSYVARKECSKSLAKDYDLEQLKALHDEFSFPFLFECACDAAGGDNDDKFKYFSSKFDLNIEQCCISNMGLHIISQTTGDHSELFVYSCRRGDWKIAETCLKSGVDVNYRDEAYGSTALMHAAQQGNVDIVKKLLEHGADASIQNDRNRDKKAIDYCVGSLPKTDEIRKILRNADGLKNECSEKELRAISEFWNSLLSDKVDMPIIKKYRDTGIPLDLSNKDTILAVCGLGYIDLVKECKTEDLQFTHPCYLTSCGSPLKMAVWEGHLDIVKYLLAILPTNPGEVLTLAIHRKKYEIVEHLIKLDDVNINFADEIIGTALHWIISREDTQMLEKFLKLDGIKVDTRNNGAFTPLMNAVIIGNETCVRLLVEAGADVSLKMNGRKAIDMTESEAIKKLLSPPKAENPKCVVKISDKVHMIDENGAKFIVFEETNKVVPLPV